MIYQQFNNPAVPGPTMYYENNSQGKKAGDYITFEPPFGVQIMNGVVKKQTVLKRWEKETRFFRLTDINRIEKPDYTCLYGTSEELATFIGTKVSIIREKSHTHVLYRERYIIDEVGIEEFIKATGRARREEVHYA